MQGRGPAVKALPTRQSVSEYRRRHEPVRDPGEVTSRRPHRAAWCWSAATIAAIAASAAFCPARAQNELPPLGVVSVLDRPREDYDPLGVRLGRYILDPTIDVLGAYDSNIFATPSHTSSDFVTTITPALNLQSDWSRHALGIKAQGEIRQFAVHTTEDVNNVSVLANGRYDIARDVYLLGGGGYQLLHEDRGSPDVLQGKSPTEFTVTSGNAGFVYAPSRLGLRLDGTVDSYGFDNVSTGDGGVINETSRDQSKVVSLRSRLSELSGDLVAP